MLERWGRIVAAHRRLIVAAALVVAVIGAGWGAGVFSKLVTGGFEDPGSGSAHADAQITRALGSQSPDVLALYSSTTATAGTPAFRDAVEAEAQRLRALPGVASVASTYDGAPGLVSRDRHATYLVIRLKALDDSGKRAEYGAIRPQLGVPGLTTQIGGSVAVDDRIDALTKTDVSRGEMIAMPLVLLLLILIFGGVAAASMPVLTGILAILGALTVTRAITLVTDVSTFAVNTITLLVLAVLALPLLHVRFGSVDERVLPPGDPARIVAERVATEFGGAAPSPVLVLLQDATPAQADGVQQRIGELPDVTGARVSAQRGSATLISASYTGGFAGTHALDAVREIRALTPPYGTRLLVGGDSATTLDEMTFLSGRLPWMLAIMALVTFGVLLLAFGSILLPVKAVLTNVASIAATFGALVWAFQDGHLAGLLDFTSTGQLEPTVLILVLAVLFGLATDYEVFLLSRVREQWDATGDNTTAVAAGLQRTGRIIITAAAALLIVVTAGFATGQIVVTKLIGAGMAAGIFLDATLIRALLVPATMRLLGRWNWWAPGPLRRPRRRAGLEPPSGVTHAQQPALAD